ncbi:MAG: HEAT repeat domain-containing protein [Chloroflexi bacterium]|nr:HEAT repeat domain-containing protein [Chloroflexota bacterium]
MIDQWIAQLSDTDPTVRRQAIIHLGRSGDPAAMPSLARIFRTDPDPELRELARRAGVHIRRTTQGAPATAAPEPEAPPEPARADGPSLLREIEQAPADEPRRSPIRELTAEDLAAEPEPDRRGIPQRGVEYNVPKADSERARRLVDQALSMNLAGENDKAVNVLAQALVADPNLINDGYFTSVLDAVTERSGDEAIHFLLDKSERKRYAQGIKKEKKQRRAEEHMSVAQQSSWSGVGFELIIYILIVVVGPVLLQLITVQSVLNFIESQRVQAEAAGVGAEFDELISEDIEIFTEQLSAAGVIALAITGLASGTIGVGSLLFQMVLIHYISTRLLRGVGTLRHLLDVLLSFYNRWLPVIFFLLCVVSGLFFVLFPSPILFCVSLPIVGVIWYMSFKTYSKIGEAYDYGAAMGCIAFSLSVFALTLINFAVVFALAQAAISLLPGFATTV